MQRNKLRGRPKIDNSSKQYEDEPGRKLKLPAKQIIPLLKRRNYDGIEEEEDSIDILEFLNEEKTKSISALQRFVVPEGLKLSASNFSTQQESNSQPQVQIAAQNMKDIIIEEPIKQQADVEENKQQQVHQTENKSILPIKDSQQQKQLHQKDHGKTNLFKLSNKQIMDALIVYLEAVKGSLKQSVIQQLSERFKVSKQEIIKLQKDWRRDHQLISSIERSNQLLINLKSVKRQRDIEDVKLVSSLLEQNPYMNQRGICDKIAENNAEYKISLTVLIRIMRKGGFNKRKICFQLSREQQEIAKITRKQFFKQYHQFNESKSTRFYYLAQCLFHQDLFNEAIWTTSKRPQPPTHSESFIAHGIIMIAFLTPEGNLLWQAHLGNYKKERYMKLLKRMMKKNCKSPNDVVVVSESPIRDLSFAQQTANKLGLSLLKLPYRADLTGPLEMFFAGIREKVKKSNYETSKELMSSICEYVQSIKQPQLLNLIQKARKI